MPERGFLSIDDLSPDGLTDLLDAAAEVKKDPSGWSRRLEGRQIALIFEKPSTRTRVSFEVAITSMGGHAIVLNAGELQLGRGETIEDTGRALSRYVDAIVLRTFGQDRLDRMADAASVPVVNALSDFEHPCQCLADLLTIREKRGSLAGTSFAYVGDGNNVAHSLMFGGGKVGLDLRIACPTGFEPFPQVTERTVELMERSGGSLLLTADPLEAARDAHILYTDVWVSMGQEDTGSRAAFVDFQIGPDLVDAANDEVLVMHCLPAHRGQEIAAEVIDGPRSIVWDQAENRLHAQKALLAWLFSS
jgi:ornithine carbamoyltransferase